MNVAKINGFINMKKDIGAINFKSEKNNSKYEKALQKRAYIESKTKTLEDLCLVSFLGVITTGFLNSSVIENKNPKTNKFCIGFAIATLALFITKFIKQIQLSKQFEKENKDEISSFE